MVSIRSFSTAAFLVGHGHAPIDYDNDRFLFADTSAPALESYRRAMASLKAVVRAKGAAVTETGQ